MKSCTANLLEFRSLASNRVEEVDVSPIDRLLHFDYASSTQLQGHPARTSPFFHLAWAEKTPSGREKAARQQGGLFFRENSSNGGKAIRTFWVAY
jgi:hypothetical protein